MSEEKTLELRVSVDVGYRRHSVAMGLSSGEVLEEFEIDHRIEGFEEFFSRIEKHRKSKSLKGQVRYYLLRVIFNSARVGDVF